MGSILDERDRQALCDRVASLSTGSTARWGRLSPEAMLGHLCLSAQMALGQIEVKPRGPGVFRVFPLKHLLLHVLPFPKGAPTAPELLPEHREPFERNRPLLLELLRGLGNGPQNGMGPAHPLFGPLSRREWGVVTHKHVDHHLKQFGA